MHKKQIQKFSKINIARKNYFFSLCKEKNTQRSIISKYALKEVKRYSNGHLSKSKLKKR